MELVISLLEKLCSKRGGADSNEDQLPKSDEIPSEDMEPDASLEDNEVDDSAGVGMRKSGALTSIVEAENSDTVDIPLETAETVEKRIDGDDDIVEGRGRGRRKKVANKLYEKFWRHNDEDNPNDDTLLP